MLDEEDPMNDYDPEQPQAMIECGQCGRPYPVPEDGYTLGFCPDCVGR